ncbi:MAG: Hsp20/alpha crystallin family protein [Syntrophomonadaceae bacterium]|nr:Hsp20/alpha crystallin family protein [Syntrophomonadaceae bacterium]HQD91242.1 Hsp20/alpha crystallin family protein [Syntrophomonadaceae bacterium]
MNRQMRPYGKPGGLFPTDFMKGLFGPAGWGNWLDHPWLPALSSIRTDIKETAAEYILEAEMPGYEKQDIEVEWQDGQLTIRAQRQQTVDENERDYVRRERSYGEVSRSFWVDNIQPEKINAEYRDGILKIVLPKASPTREPGKKIDIN